MEETADTVARVSRPGAKGQQAELWTPTLEDFSEEGCLTRVLKIHKSVPGGRAVQAR